MVRDGERLYQYSVPAGGTCSSEMSNNVSECHLCMCNKYAYTYIHVYIYVRMWRSGYWNRAGIWIPEPILSSLPTNC